VRRSLYALTLITAAPALWYGLAGAQEPRRIILPEQRRMQIRDPSQLRRAPLPSIPPPRTVANPQPAALEWKLTLDEAIRTALANADVVRVLAGVTATSSGRTIYDPAVTNTQIDVNRAPFDPTISSRNTFSRTELPVGAITAPGPPPSVSILANPTQGFQSATGVSKRFLTGGTAALDVNVNRNDVGSAGFLPNGPLPLNPQTRSDTTLSLTQPVLQGAGYPANIAPIVVARIDTERSFFQMKDSVQDMVRGVVEAYWQLSFAQVDVWARRQQVEQGSETLGRAIAELEVGRGTAANEAQARVSYEGFRASLVVAEANLLEREAALRNIMGVLASDNRRLVPASDLSTTKLPVDWNTALSLAEENRPDLIELKLILEADDQELLLARNTALPRLDAEGLYRWNGLEGHTPAGNRIGTNGEFADWELGVNFSVPLGLRRERALVRQRELLIMRDRANLDQGLHAASHSLAASLRSLDQNYAQYQAFRRVREAARVNLEQQLAENVAGRPILLLNVLQAITDWGNAVSNENQSLAQYNIELATLERETGTILESHGVRFYEERYGSIGPCGRLFRAICYPRDMRPSPNIDRLPPAAGETYQLPEMVRLPEVDDRRAVPETLPAPRR